MRLDEFHELKTGDELYHPKTGVVKVKTIFHAHNYTTTPPTPHTWALETEDGQFVTDANAHDIIRLNKDDYYNPSTITFAQLEKLDDFAINVERKDFVRIFGEPGKHLWEKLNTNCGDLLELFHHMSLENRLKLIKAINQWEM